MKGSPDNTVILHWDECRTSWTKLPWDDWVRFRGCGADRQSLLAGAKEIRNTSLKNLKDVRAYTNMPVLSSIPLLENALLIRRKRRLLWLAWSSAIIIGSIAMSGSAYYYYFGHNT